VFAIDEEFWVHQNPFTLLQAPAHLEQVDEVDPASFQMLTDDDLDRFVEEGLAIDHEPIGVERINPDVRWCHRCGTSDDVEGYVDPFNGNVTLLCRRCEVAQARMAGVMGEIDPAILEQLDSQGYAVVSLLDTDETAAARALTDDLDVPDDVGFYAMNQAAPRDIAVRTDLALQSIGQGAVDRVLPGFRVFKGVPVIKGARGDNPVGLHQDWEYVDERYHRGYVIWAPLDGATSAEGGLHVIPGSHRWLDNHRGSGFADPFEGVADEIIRRASVPVDLEPGQAVIYDNALLHHSPPNRGSRQRVAVAFAVAPPGAPVVHLHTTDGRQAEVFEVPANDDFFTREPFGSRPSWSPSRVVEIDQAPVTVADLDAWLPVPV
jgi:hypothetical protein